MRDVVHVVDQWVAERAEVDAGRGVGRWVAFTDLQNGVSPDALVVVGGDAVADERGRVCDAPEFADDGQAECISEEYADGQAVGLLAGDGDGIGACAGAQSARGDEQSGGAKCAHGVSCCGHVVFPSCDFVKDAD